MYKEESIKLTVLSLFFKLLFGVLYVRHPGFQAFESSVNFVIGAHGNPAIVELLS